MANNSTSPKISLLLGIGTVVLTFVSLVIASLAYSKAVEANQIAKEANKLAAEANIYNKKAVTPELSISISDKRIPITELFGCVTDGNPGHLGLLFVNVETVTVSNSGGNSVSLIRAEANGKDMVWGVNIKSLGGDNSDRPYWLLPPVHLPTEIPPGRATIWEVITSYILRDIDDNENNLAIKAREIGNLLVMKYIFIFSDGTEIERSGKFTDLFVSDSIDYSVRCVDQLNELGIDTIP